LINDVLDLSKIEAGRMDLYLERFDLRQMLDETVSTVTPVVVKNNNEFVTDFGDNLGNMRADMIKVRQSTVNLLSNAAKFTENGTITLAARREPGAAGDWIYISVADTGIGISEETFDKVFEEFSQADESTTRNYGGTGLGLPISQRFCRLMGGDITLESKVGQGSIFTIQLPAEVKSTTLITSATGAKSSIEEQQIETGGTRPVLVIDDDGHARDLLLRTLELDGHVVVSADDGEEGLELARSLNPSLITLDILMPGMDGWTVLQRLKSDPELEHIPVIMVSIVADKDMGYTLGAVESLTKPVDRKQLLQLVDQFTKTEASRHALVVEDDETTRSMIRRAMEEAGWEISEAENGAAAIELVADRKPNLILLDLMMPVMDGFEFVYVLRQQAENRSIPIIVVTALDLTEEDQKRLAGGVERIISKGAHTQDELLALIREEVAQHSRTKNVA
jgi:CheY-like chemotaxis protein